MTTPELYEYQKLIIAEWDEEIPWPPMKRDEPQYGLDFSSIVLKWFNKDDLISNVESIHRKLPTTRELMQAGSRSAEVNAKLDKWIDAKIPPVGAYYMPKWLGKVDIEDSVEYDSLGLPLKEVGGYDLNSGRGYDSLGLRRGLDDFGTKYWVEPQRDCLGLVKYIPIWIPDSDSENAIKQAPCGEFVTFNGFPIRCNPTLG